MPTNAPICALVLISPLQLHLPPTRGANSIPVAAKQNYARGRKPKKLQTLSLVCFPSTMLLQLHYLILEHRILSYMLHMLGSIICP
jgi:hypothetical protein